MKKICGVVCFFVLSSAASASNWDTSYSTDEMRGTAQKFVQTDSDNNVDFDFPYNGGSGLGLMLRSKKTQLKDGQSAEGLKLSEAAIVISKGQFNCNSFDDCHISAKFDDGKIQKFAMSPAKGGRADVLFFDNPKPFIDNVKSHKRLIIEADFYNSGPKQFKFDLSGAEPPKP